MTGPWATGVNAWRQEHPEPDQPLSPAERARVKELEDDVARLRMENEFGKSPGLLRAGAPVAERCAVTGAEKANYKISWMCALLGVPRSSFYAWRNRAKRAAAARRRELAVLVTAAFEAGRGAYVCRRVTAQQAAGPSAPGMQITRSAAGG